jgi:hypothetical protein
MKRVVCTALVASGLILAAAIQSSANKMRETSHPKIGALFQKSQSQNAKVLVQVPDSRNGIPE